MRKFMTLLAILCSTLAFSQPVTQINRHILHDTSEPVKDTLKFYVAAGVSIGNGTEFKLSSYPSIEFGASKGALSYGAVFGNSTFTTKESQPGLDDAGKPFWEAKISASAPIGQCKGYILFGVGNYFGTSNTFIEYGSGVTFSFKPFDTFVQVSNWDRGDYVSIGLSKTFN
jgi:hypothetical protein